MSTLLDRAAVGARTHHVGPRPRPPAGVVVFVGFVATLAAAVPLELVRTVLPWTVATALMAVVVAAVSWWAHAGSAACIAAMGWLMLNGFVVHEYGNLGWDGPRDVVRLATLVLAALAAPAARALVVRARLVRGRRSALDLVVPLPRSPDHDRM